MKRIRGGSGLGDSIYIRPIAEYFISIGEQVVVCSDYADIFKGSGAKVEGFRRDRVDVVAHYVNGKSDQTTNQWQDICKSAKVSAPMHFEWDLQNNTLVKDLQEKADGRPIILVHGGRVPMGRTDGFGMELLPNKKVFNDVLSEFDDCFLVLVGKGEQSYKLNVDIDLNGKTSVSDIFDIAKISRAVVGQCSFAIPLAECLGKPLLAIWSSAAANSNHAYIKTITPKKILSKSSSKYIFDDWEPQRIKDTANAFRNF